MATELSLHPLAVEDAIKAQQRPKLDDYEDSLFVVLKTVRYDDATGHIDVGDVMVFLGPGFLVTVRHGDHRALTDVRERLEQDPALLAKGPPAALYAICDRVVDDYTEVSQELEQDIAQVEALVFSPAGSREAEPIYAIKREVIAFRRVVHPLLEPMSRLASGRVDEIPEPMLPYFRDVLDHVSRASDLVSGFDDLVSSVLNANLTEISVRQNNDMRRISAWVAIVAVPTMIAGIYGMNFEHMPELTWRYGYPLAVGVMAVACTVLYRLFKRSGWL